MQEEASLMIKLALGTAQALRPLFAFGFPS